MNIIRRILKCASLTTALFVFQACYGTPGVMNSAEVSFLMVDSESGEALSDISMNMRTSGSDEAWQLAGISNMAGQMRIFIDKSALDTVTDIHIFSEDGKYEQKDTTVVFADSPYIEIKLQKVSKGQ